MTNLNMFCISTNPKHLKIIKELNYIPVGLGGKEFDSNWVTDKVVNGITHKNSYYGEYTFHYSLWKKNSLKEDKWIGFCQYRKFWSLRSKINQELSLDQFKSTVLQSIPKELNNFDAILGEEIFVNQFRLTKFLKRNFKKMIFNPSLIFRKNKRNLKFHFDMWHGEGNIDKAAELLDKAEKNDFIEFINRNTSFNPHNMIICKNKKTLFAYYDSVFPWLKRCEKVFGFEKLKGYGFQRMYGFLAERYLSYWFKKYANYTVIPILFKDISDYSYKNL